MWSTTSTFDAPGLLLLRSAAPRSSFSRVQEMPRLDLDAHRDAGDLIATTLVLFARHALLFLSVTLLVVAPLVVLVTGVWAGGFADGGGGNVATAPAIATAILLFLMPVLVTALHVT